MRGDDGKPVVKKGEMEKKHEIGRKIGQRKPGGRRRGWAKARKRRHDEHFEHKVITRGA